MKEVIAIIRPGHAAVTKKKLADKGFVSYTEKRVLGRGRQHGLDYPDHNGAGLSFLSKKMLTVFVEDEKAAEVVTIIVEANKTGQIGDGKIFICSPESAIRVRTDELNHVALV